MSGYTAAVIARHSLLHGGLQFLQKPFTVRSLTGKVREVLENAGYSIVATQVMTTVLTIRTVLAGFWLWAGLGASLQAASNEGSPPPGQVLASLTEAERVWLRDHPVITVGHDPDWAPVEFSDERGELTGISGDYLDLVEERLGVKFKRIPNLSWQEVYARQQRWEIDMATCVAAASGRSNFWAFTRPYVSIPIVIATRSEVGYIGDMKELFGRKVAVVKSYAIDDWVTHDFPEIDLARFTTVPEGLAALQRGEVFAYLDNLLIIGDYQAKLKVGQIKIAGQTPYVNAQRMAVRKDWAPLAGILDKALASISEAERQDIYRRWVPIRYEHGFDYALFWKLLAGFAAILLALAVWNRRLAREVRNRQGAEAALRESEARTGETARLLEALFDAIPDVIGVQDGHRRIIRYNAAGHRFLGLSPEQVRGRFCYELIGRVKPCELCATAEALQTRKPSRIEKHMPESGLWLECRSYPVLDAGGEVVYIIEHLRDITERRQAETALREKTEELDGFFTTTLDLLCVADADGCFRRLNPQWETVLGYPLAELEGRRFLDLIHPEDLDATVQAVARLAAQQPVLNFVNRYRCRDGSYRWFEWRSSPRGKLIYAAARDITERRQAQMEQERLQSQLTQAQKMESVGRLAGGVAHDFNNMLQAILGNVALALQDLPADSPLRENLGEIEESAQRSADLTRQLLAFARKQTIAPKVLDLNDTVAGMLKMLRRLIGEDIHLAWIPGAELWPIKMDPSQIDQVVANLCVNARDAIGGVGTVTLETANVTLDEIYVATHPEVVAGDYVLLAVSDTGRGMDAETRSHLFEPFFTTKEQGKGTGLGLATVFGIVKQNQGLISVYSEPGQGTTFKIYLPRAEAEATAAAAARRCDVRGTETVLLVEDEAQVMTLGRRILERYGYTVLAASTPEAALALAAQSSAPIDLLITDVVMPGMNGKELVARLRPGHPGLRCLFISGYTANVIAHHGVLDAGVAFLQKPFTIESLVHKVREVLAEPAEP